jgi:hypothetical protein
VALTQLFAQYGPIIGVTTRRKPGANKSWALITFASAIAAEACLAGSVTYESHVCENGSFNAICI